jgi:hypothetical protein
MILAFVRRASSCKSDVPRYNSHAEWSDRLLECFRDLCGQALLYLKSSGSRKSPSALELRFVPNLPNPQPGTIAVTVWRRPQITMKRSVDWLHNKEMGVTYIWMQ